MRGALYALAASVLLGGAATATKQAHRHAHQAFHDLMKREEASAADNATCVCTTYYSTIYGEATLIQPAPAAATSTTAPPPPPPTTTSTPPPASSSAPASSAAAAAASPSSPPVSHAGSSASISGGSHWAMTYSPYNADTTCKNPSDIASDIATIASKGFSAVRIYSTDCKGLQYIVPAAQTHGMKVLLGIFISGSGISAAEGQIGDITSFFQGNYGMVEMVVVGNEAVFNGFCSASDLAAFITQVKTTLSAAGYNGPVTTTEPMSIIQSNAATFCAVIDVVAANIHPFFNSDISASQAGEFVATSLTELAGYCPGKVAWNLETGWPSAGQPNGAAVPGTSEQAIAVPAIVATAGSKSVVFSFENDLWKHEGEFGVEQSWGCSQLFE